MERPGDDRNKSLKDAQIADLINSANKIGLKSAVKEQNLIEVINDYFLGGEEEDSDIDLDLDLDDESEGKDDVATMQTRTLEHSAETESTDERPTGELDLDLFNGKILLFVIFYQKI